MIRPLRVINDLVRVRSNFQVMILVDHNIGPEVMQRVTNMCDKDMAIPPIHFK